MTIDASVTAGSMVRDASVPLFKLGANVENARYLAVSIYNIAPQVVGRLKYSSIHYLSIYRLATHVPDMHCRIYS